MSTRAKFLILAVLLIIAAGAANDAHLESTGAACFLGGLALGFIALMSEE